MRSFCDRKDITAQVEIPYGLGAQIWLESQGLEAA